LPHAHVTCRFAGPAYKFLFGYDISGKDWIALTAPDERAECLAHDTGIVLGAIGTSRRRDPNRHGVDEWFGDIQLPFANISEDGTRSYLRHSDWRPRGHELSLRRSRTSDMFIAESVRVVPIRCRHADGEELKPNRQRAETRDRDELPRFDGQRVVVVDDDAAIRELLALHLETAGLHVIALDRARALLEGDYDKTAHCIVSDIRMPDIDGLELQEELNRRKARVPFIVVTAHGYIPLAVRVMRAGAVDVLEKPFRPASLLSAIERALALGANLDADDPEGTRSSQRLEALSSREREVFDLLAEGKASKAIADALGISQRTVDGHRANVMHKLKVRNVGELVRLALGAR
jgi:two-component system response regulator FixJ